MKSINNFLAFSLLIILVCCQLPQNYTKTSNLELVDSIRNIGYSPNHKFLIVISNKQNSSFYLYNGIHLNNKTQIQIKDKNKNSANPSSFLFTKNNDKLIVGTIQGGVYVYNINAGAWIDNDYSTSFTVGGADEENQVYSVSLSKDNKLAVGIHNTLLILNWNQQGNLVKQSQKLFPNFKLLSVLWAPAQSNIVFIGGIGVNSQFSSIDIDANFTQVRINNNYTYTAAFLPDGKTLLQGSISQNIKVYQYTNSGVLPTLISNIEGSNTSSQIIISSDGNFVGAQTFDDNVLVWKVVQKQSSPNNLQLQPSNYQKITASKTFELKITNPGSNLALSNDANNILIVPNDLASSSVQRYILCQDGTYLKQGDCKICNQQLCKTCFDQSTCLSCQIGKYVDGDACITCNEKLDGCLQCNDQSTCTKCDETASWSNNTKQGKCQCIETYYINDHKCALCSQALLDCSLCSDENKCDKCKEENNFNPDPKDGQCICKPQYFLNQKLCQDCDKKIFFCQQCTMDGTICKKCNQQQNRQLNKDDTLCVCKAHYYQDSSKCTLCDQFQLCLQCQVGNPSNCTKCDTDKKRQSAPVDGKCQCVKGFYDDQNGNCIQCSIKLVDCLQCSQDGSTCLSCKEQNNFNPKPQDGKCVCNQGWVLDIDKCLTCSQLINGCVVCSDKDTCKKCDKNSNFEQQPNAQGKCVCQKKYWLNNTGCSLCNEKIPFCSLCSQTGQICTQCNADTNREPQNNNSQCLCKDFYYQDKNDKLCKLCDQKMNCVKCDQTKKCSLCDTNKHWKPTPVEGICQCQTGYNLFNNSCILCNVVGCQVCQTSSTCENCSQQKGFKPQPTNKTTCQCAKGRYKDNKNKVCLFCNQSLPGCLTCLNPTDCQVCDDSKHFEPNPQLNSCKCQASFYALDKNTCDSCNNKIIHCNTCQVVNGNIVLCDTCQKGYGTSGSRLNCFSCQVGCINCTDAQTCTQCDSDNKFILDSTTKKCKCIDNYYLKMDVCQLCSSTMNGCITCLNQTFCLSCNSSAHFIAEPHDGKCKCQDGKTLDSDVCKSCQQLLIGCLQCQDPTVCTKCDTDNNFQPIGNNCKCNNKFYLNVKKCDICNKVLPNCETCQQDGKTCDSCSSSDRVVNPDKTACICKDFNYEDDKNQCQLCDQLQKCIHCVDPTNCTKCNTDKRWQQQSTDGKCKCQDQYKLYNDACYKCDVVGCLSCSGDNVCISCDQAKKFSSQPIQNKCVCKDGAHTKQGNQSQCYDCNQKLVGCQECDNLTQCKLCDANSRFILNNNTKLCECDHHFFFDQKLSKCIQCQKAIKYCDTCVVNKDIPECDSCQKGFEPADDKKSCLNCEDQIIGCTGCFDIDKCEQCDTAHNFILNTVTSKCDCINGYFIDTQQKKCVSCDDTIPGCISCNQKGDKCIQCNGIHNFILNKNTQVCDCQIGFYILNRACAFCSTKIPGCTECNVLNGQNCKNCEQSRNFIYNNNTLLCDCVQGYFIKDSSCQLCQTLIPGCKTCSKDGKQCFQCNGDEHFKLDQISKTCNCQQLYFYDQQIQKCLLCSDYIVGCDDCTAQGECKQCVGDHFVLNSSSKKCDCQSGYFVKEKLCGLCTDKLSGCSNCSQDGSQCFQCNTQQHFVLDQQKKQCVCSVGYFQKQKKCILCDQNIAGCTQCSQDGSKCLKCDLQHFSLDPKTNKCVCQAYYYISSIEKCSLCSQSINNCVSCNSNSQVSNNFVPYCTQCQNNFDISPDKTQCQCTGDKQVNDQGVCVDKQKSDWYIFVIIGAAVVIVGGGAGYFIIKKCRKDRIQLTQQYEALGQQINKSNKIKKTKPETILTDNSNPNNASSYELD